MKKDITTLIGFIAAILIFTGCLSSGVETSYYELEVPFEGTIDSRFGYEGFYWGMHLDDITNAKEYPVVSDYSSALGEYKYFYGYKSSSDYYFHGAHNIVKATDFYFNNKRLFQVVDTLKDNEFSIEELHERYGDFSEENIASEFSDSKLKAVYSNRNLFDNTNMYSLLIKIQKNGYTKVYMTDPLANYSLNDSTLRDFLVDDKELPANKWFVFGSTDGSNKLYNYLIRNVNDEGKSIILRYCKNPDDSILSSLRIGFNTDIESMGIYEIKTKDGIVEKYLDSSTYSYKSIYYGASLTDNKKLSVREFYDILLNNETISVRKNNETFKFYLEGLNEALNLFGITMDELDFAIANEEF